MGVFDNINQKLWNEIVSNNPWMQGLARPKLVPKYNNRPVVDKTTEIAENNLLQNRDLRYATQHMNDDIVDQGIPESIVSIGNKSHFTQGDEINIGTGSSTIKIGGRSYNIWNKDDMIALQTLLTEAGVGNKLRGKYNGVDGIFGTGTVNALNELMKIEGFNGRADYNAWFKWANDQYMNNNSSAYYLNETTGKYELRPVDNAKFNKKYRSVNKMGGIKYFDTLELADNWRNYAEKGAKTNTEAGTTLPTVTTITNTDASATTPSQSRTTPQSPTTSTLPINTVTNKTNYSGLTFEAGLANTKWGGVLNDLDFILDAMGIYYNPAIVNNKDVEYNNFGQMTLTEEGAKKVNNWLLENKYIPLKYRHLTLSGKYKDSRYNDMLFVNNYYGF